MNGATQQTALQEKSASQMGNTYVARTYAAQSPTSGMAPFTIRRRVPRPQDVQIEILYCGVCHSDLAYRTKRVGRVRGQPSIPACRAMRSSGVLSLSGRSSGSSRWGESGPWAAWWIHAAVLPLRAGSSSICDVSGQTFNYILATDTQNAGDLRRLFREIVVDEAFRAWVPDMPTRGCGAAAVRGHHHYSPLRHWQVGRGQKVGVVGLGGSGTWA